MAVTHLARGLQGWALAALLLMPLCCVAQPLGLVDGELPRVSLLTFAPGEVYWQRFGHNALLLRARDGRAVVYNYGIFDFRQKNFFLNFARGQMLYRLDAESLYRTLEQYASEDRWVYEQQLDLGLQQRRALNDLLAENLRPENIEYRYDYLAANCSTRVRDVIDRAIGGALRRQLQARGSAASYRSEVTRLMAPDPLLAIGMDLGLGPRVDRVLDGWALSFIPERLMQGVRETRIEEDGVERPLVKAEGWLYRSERAAAPVAPLSLWAPLLAAGVATAAAIVLLARWRQVFAARAALTLIAASLSLAAGLLGLVMLAAWVFTEHWGMWDNQNLLLANPLLLLLMAPWFASRRAPWRPGPLACVLAGATALMAVASLLIKWLPGVPRQENLAWIGLFLPIHLAFAIVLWTQRRRFHQVT